MRKFGWINFIKEEVDFTRWLFFFYVKNSKQYDFFTSDFDDYNCYIRPDTTMGFEEKQILEYMAGNIEIEKKSKETRVYGTVFPHVTPDEASEEYQIYLLTTQEKRNR